MLSIVMTLHLLTALIWVGGMFFAHMALRPVAASLLEPPQRLPLLHGVLGRFFSWVWGCVLSILGSGLWLFIGPLGARGGLYIHAMMGLGLLMALIFFFIYFYPYRRMGAALAAGRIPVAGDQMALIRRLIGFNLLLGLLTTLLAGLKIA
ncbi:MAG: CopD family protein [Candidatus Sedimenticola endophacoides]